MVSHTGKEKSFTAINGGPTWPGVCFLSPFIQMRTEIIHPVPTKRAFYSSAKPTSWLHSSGANTHLPLSCPFCWYSSRTLPELTTQPGNCTIHIFITAIKHHQLQAFWGPRSYQKNLRGLTFLGKHVANFPDTPPTHTLLTHTFPLCSTFFNSAKCFAVSSRIDNIPLWWVIARR